MAKTKISQYDATAANNTDIDSINIAEGMAPSNVNNAIRELMAHLKDMDAGTQALTSPQLTSADINGGTIDGVTIGGASAGAGTFTNLTATGTTTLAGASTSADITFGDNDKAIFGAGSDLQIYHDGSNSYISDVGTGNLYLKGSSSIFLQHANNDVGFKSTANSSAILYFDNLERLETTGTGIDVTGTVTADGLTVDGIAVINGPNNVEYNSIVKAVSNNGTVSTSLSFGGLSGSNNLKFYTNDSVLRQNISNNGDISFYEDTGTTPKFFWDASAESLGIGTSSPAYRLHVVGTNPSMVVESSNSSGSFIQFRNTSSPSGINRIGYGVNDFIVDTNGTERMRIDSSGNVGIGTSSPSEKLHVNSGGGNVPALFESTDTLSLITFKDNDTTQTIGVGAQDNAGVFYTAGTERMRITSGGNLLVGTTVETVASSSTETGVRMGDGFLQIGRSNSDILILNRQTSDGDIALFRKDGSTVGSIGTLSGNLFIGSTNGSDAYLGFSNTFVIPVTSTGANRDNAISLGNAAARFDDIFATNGTIQTSDRNEKQDIAELSDAEQRVAVAAKGLLRKFRWKDAVAEKGDEARTHFGIIAQDLQAAFAAEGLDAGDYAMFISSTWTDEETGEERTRMGVRYSELLAFIIAAI